MTHEITELDRRRAKIIRETLPVKALAHVDGPALLRVAVAIREFDELRNRIIGEMLDGSSAPHPLCECHGVPADRCPAKEPLR